ncbi:MAG: DinB family protein [Isosphaeraceae bacterium]
MSTLQDAEKLLLKSRIRKPGEFDMPKSDALSGKNARRHEKTATKSTATPPTHTGARNRREPIDLGRALVEAYLTNERINQVLIDSLDPKIWRAQPACSKRRNIATTFAHMHNVRCMRLAMSVRDEKPPGKLDRAEVTPSEAKEALATSAAAMVRLIEHSIEAGGHVPDLRPDVVALVCAAITHDAHHRGQICHWANQLGAPLTPEQALRMWEWDKRWKEVAGG